VGLKDRRTGQKFNAPAPLSWWGHTNCVCFPRRYRLIHNVTAPSLCNYCKSLFPLWWARRWCLLPVSKWRAFLMMRQLY